VTRAIELAMSQKTELLFPLSIINIFLHRTENLTDLTIRWRLPGGHAKHNLNYLLHCTSFLPLVRITTCRPTPQIARLYMSKQPRQDLNRCVPIEKGLLITVTTVQSCMLRSLNFASLLGRYVVVELFVYIIAFLLCCWWLLKRVSS
jgi:hypothetical protein